MAQRSDQTHTHDTAATGAGTRVDATGEAAGDATGEATGEAAGDATAEATGEAAGDATGEAAGEATGDADTPDATGGGAHTHHGTARKRELGRGERVLPGVFRLRLPLPWPGVPHGNAWAVAAGDGVVLFDTGIHESGSMAQLERALEMCNLRVQDIRLVVCTHAHSDHYGQAATIVARTGCELWMHPNYEHMARWADDSDAAFARRLEIARQSGVPAEPLRRYAEQRGSHDSGIAAVIPPDRPLLPGVTIATDLGEWTVHETPGHAPSHVCLFQPERRLLISGDHLLGRISLYFDYGYSADPVGEFVHSLDVVDALDARLCLPGHGRTFTDVRAHIEGNRTLVAQRIERILQVIAPAPITAFEAAPQIYDDVPFSSLTAAWLLTETLAFLLHLERTGRARRIAGEPERWTIAAG